MSLRVAGGLEEDGITIGNAYDKYGSSNLIVKRLMSGFENALHNLVQKSGPMSIHEVGCGEGYWVMKWLHQGLDARGCDFSTKVIELAKANAVASGLNDTAFSCRSIYDLEPSRDSADLIVCCEVLEHLEDPRSALKSLQLITSNHIIISVPSEPLWRILNIARGKYLFQAGNTPGHIQHWSPQGITTLVSEYFEVIERQNPIPWTMLYCRVRS